MTIFFAILFGLAVGSFINVLVFRVHADIPLTGRSKCRTCEIPVDSRDLVPVLSFFLLRGRCRNCKSAISLQYPAIEATTAVLFAISAVVVGPFMSDQDLLPAFLRLAVFLTFLIIVFVYDLEYGYILDKFTFPAMMVAVLFNLVLGSVTAASMVTGAVAVGGFFLAQYLVSGGKWIGGGDIRMGALMGFMLGFGQGLLALFLAYAVGAVVGSFLLFFKKKKLGSHIPFGTFLSVGTTVALFWGSVILDWYLEAVNYL